MRPHFRRRHARANRHRPRERHSRSALLAYRLALAAAGGLAWCSGAERSEVRGGGCRRHPGTRCLSGGRTPSFDDRREQALFWSVADTRVVSRAAATPRRSAKRRLRVGTPFSRQPEAASTAPHAHPKPERIEGGAAGGARRHDESEPARGDRRGRDDRHRHGEGSGWRRRLSVRGTSAKPKTQAQRPPHERPAREPWRDACGGGNFVSIRGCAHSAPS